MTVSEALATLDWSAFHPCGHPVQRPPGAAWTPCAECYRHANVYTTVLRDPHWDWNEKVSSTPPVVKETRLRRTSFVVRGAVFEDEPRRGKRRVIEERGTGFLWVPLGVKLEDSMETYP
jgi:hypothetical protein